MKKQFILLSLITFVVTSSAWAQLEPISRISQYVEHYNADQRSLQRKYRLTASSSYYERMQRLYNGWLDKLEKVDYNALSTNEAVDFILLRRNIRNDLQELQQNSDAFNKIKPVIPFQNIIESIREKRRVGKNLEGKVFGQELARLSERITAVQDSLEKEDKLDVEDSRRAVEATENLKETLEEAYEFYYGYDPDITWWAEKPYKQADSTLSNYISFLKKWKEEEQADDGSGIIGNPVGAEKLRQLLDYAMIPYSAEELVELANKEYEWCMEQMLKASNELGYGDDWKAALEHVKDTYVEPGQQPEMIYGLAQEATSFLKEHDMITVPEIAADGWGMRMMSPERQLINPFFTGGVNITISYPTNTMAHDDKMMSMRGNNPNFSKATVHHELLPGHHLQYYYQIRYNSYRRAFGTPFWTEGWALYWELKLWDMGFPETPEQRIGMLFWRMHRCARIIFSLSYHLGEMNPQEAIDFLVDKVGHEYANAEAEVRRSFASSYPPLYQAAYLLGGLQIRSMYDELVENGSMTPTNFHDSFLKNGSMPIEMMRYLLKDEKPGKDFETQWRFYENLE